MMKKLALSFALALLLGPIVAWPNERDPKPQPQPDTVYVEKKSNSRLWVGIGLGALAGAGLWWALSSHDECPKKEEPTQPKQPAAAPAPAVAQPVMTSPAAPITPVIPTKPRAAAKPKPKSNLECEKPAAPKPVTRMGFGVDQTGVVGLKVRHDF